MRLLLNHSIQSALNLNISDFCIFPSDVPAAPGFLVKSALEAVLEQRRMRADDLGLPAPRVLALWQRFGGGCSTPQIDCWYLIWFQVLIQIHTNLKNVLNDIDLNHVRMEKNLWSACTYHYPLQEVQSANHPVSTQSSFRPRGDGPHHPAHAEVCGSAFSGKSALCQVCKGGSVALELLAGLVNLCCVGILTYMWTSPLRGF